MLHLFKKKNRIKSLIRFFHSLLYLLSSLYVANFYKKDSIKISISKRVVIMTKIIITVYIYRINIIRFP